MQADHWAFGWEALVAIGTLILAGGTAYLAWTTAKLASASRREINEAWRPLIAITTGTTSSSPETGRRVELLFKNEGRGPALDMRIAIRPGKTEQRGVHWSIAVLAAGAQRSLEVHADAPALYRGRMMMQVAVDYTDLGRAEHGVVADVGLPWGGGDGATVAKIAYRDRYLVEESTPPENYGVGEEIP